MMIGGRSRGGEIKLGVWKIPRRITSNNPGSKANSNILVMIKPECNRWTGPASTSSAAFDETADEGGQGAQRE
jgi:hypothetical protein